MQESTSRHTTSGRSSDEATTVAMPDSPIEITDVRLEIQRSMERFSNGERKVARALLAKYPTAALTTAADLAAEANVSPPTVIRFATRLGLQGFPALQRAIVREMNSELGSPLRQHEAKTVGTRVLQHTSTAFQQMIERTYADLPESEFDKLADLLANPTKTILVTGGRLSGLLAEYLALHLNLMRSNISFVGPGEITQRALVVDSGPNTVLLTFDFRRYAAESCRFAESVASTGATVSLITDQWMSPIARCSHVVLPVQVDSASPFDSIVAATAVVESLIAAVNSRLGDQALTRLRAIEELREHDTDRDAEPPQGSVYIT